MRSGFRYIDIERRLKKHIMSVYAVHALLVMLSVIYPTVPWLLAWGAFLFWPLVPCQKWLDRLTLRTAAAAQMTSVSKTNRDLVDYCWHRFIAEIMMTIAYHLGSVVGDAAPMTAFFILYIITFYGLFISLMPMIRMEWSGLKNPR